VIERPVCVMSLRHGHAVRRLENGLNLRELQQELGHTSVRTTERYRHCLAPKVVNHPFSQIRKLEERYAKTSSLETTDVHHGPANTPPLTGLDTISLCKLRLPFDSTNGKSRAAVFLEFLTNRLIVGLIRTNRPRSP